MTGEMAALSEGNLADLQQRLALADLYSRSTIGETIEFLVLRRGGIKVRMWQELNHRRSHFHIEYKQEFKATYAVDTLERLAGYMPSRYEKPILEWATANRPRLEATWRKLEFDGTAQEVGLSGDGQPKGA